MFHHTEGSNMLLKIKKVFFGSMIEESRQQESEREIVAGKLDDARRQLDRLLAIEEVVMTGAGVEHKTT